MNPKSKNVLTSNLQEKLFCKVQLKNTLNGLWLKNKDTVLFWGVWERLDNRDINSPEFEGIGRPDGVEETQNCKITTTSRLPGAIRRKGITN